MVSHSLKQAVRSPVRKIRSLVKLALISYPKRVCCNICGWQGRHFLSDEWHPHIHCPGCGSDIRQRLFFAALQEEGPYSWQALITGKKILHFAPEEISRARLKSRAAQYVTTDYLRDDCDLQLDMSAMTEVEDGSVDLLIAFDVLEHVPSYQRALQEVQRVLRAGGFAIFTVPQQDGLPSTREDPTITTPEERTRHYGQWDHLRIFGDDFASLVAAAGFEVTPISEQSFSPEQVRRNVLFPPQLSAHPLATNHRKVFFCQKPA
jgi:SAM-dependent methyltransferase